MKCMIDLSRVSRTAPALAGDEAFRLFCLPRESPHRSGQYDILAARARHHLEAANWFTVESPVGAIQAYAFDPPAGLSGGRDILIVHGWTSEAAFMSAFIEPLRRHGHRLVLFDLPAHGRSVEGSQSRGATMIDCARGALAVAEAAGPFDTVIAHSIGGLVALLIAEGAEPLKRAAPIGRFALIATPNRFRQVTGDFGRTLGLTPAAQRAFDRRLERVGHRSLDSFEARAILQRLKAPALIVHSRDDAQVPYSSAEEIMQSGLPQVTLANFDQLGHAKVLFAPPAIRIIRDFCRQEA